MTNRMERINQLLREELGYLLQTDAEVFGIVDIVDVRTSRDLANAEVFLASLSQRPEREIIKQVEARAGEYGRILGKRLNLKRIPHFNFKFDADAEAIQRVESLFDEISSPVKSRSAR